MARSSEQRSINLFQGLNSDSHPVNTKNSDMTHALNATLTTNGENQLILQNLEGNHEVANITDDYHPLGVGVYRGISYIISAKYDDEGNFENGQIGTFPSPDWENLLAGGIDDTYYLPLKNEYRNLVNFSTATGTTVLADDLNYNEDFRTPKLNLEPGDLIEVELQESYDGSVNIIFNDDFNPIRLVNSRFKISEDGKRAAIADRRQAKDTNTYSEKEFGATRLIRQSDVIPNLVFNGLETGGYWNGGGLKFYFRYTDSDGALTDIIEESGLVAIPFEGYGARQDEIASKVVKFTMTNLDKKFSGLKVYYSYASGETDTTTSVKEILNIYDLPEGDELQLYIYGNETTVDIPLTELNLDYSSINTAKSITQTNDRLLIGNISGVSSKFDYLKEISQTLKIEERSQDLIIKGLDQGYSDPENVYYRLGLWGGETYEYAIVYVLSDGRGVTPGFPLRGLDNLDGTATYSTTSIIDTNDGFLANSSENRLGAYRTSIARETLTGVNSDSSEIKYVGVNIETLLTDPVVQEETIGFFFVRRDRLKDCILQGYFTNTTHVPVDQLIDSTDRYDFEGYGNVEAQADERISFHWQDPYYGIGTNTDAFAVSTVDLLTLKYVPAPGRIFQSIVTSGNSMDDGLQDRRQRDPGFNLTQQGIVWPQPNDTFRGNTYAFYSADALVNPVLMASLFNNSRKGFLLQDGAFEAYSDVLPEGPLKELSFRNFNFNPPLNQTNQPASYFTYVNEYTQGYADKSFSTVLDRNIYTITGRIQDATSPYDPHRVGFNGLNLEGEFLAENQIRFSDYIGVKLDSDYGLGTYLRNDDKPSSNTIIEYPGNFYTPENDHITSHGDYYEYIFEKGIRFGVMANIYNSPEGIMTQSSWKTKYANSGLDRSYTAVSKRYSWDTFIPGDKNVIDIFRGDCYLDFTYKRSAYGLGIEEAPTAVTPETYEDGNRSGGLYSTGFVFPLICESNYNTALRSFENYSEVEKALYGKDRTFYPIDDIDELRSSRQLESHDYNHGYHFNLSDRIHVGLNDRAPKFIKDYANRVMVSASSIDSSFTNGYTDFRGFNFRDYNKQLGPITKVITLRDKTYCIFEEGIGVVPLNERALLGTENANDIYIDDASVLGSKMQVISNEYGSNQQFSIIATDMFIYGVDLVKNKVWRIEGMQLKVISDFAVQTILNQFKKIIESNIYKSFVKANYDRERNNVVFSYFNVKTDGTFTNDIYSNVGLEFITEATVVENSEALTSPVESAVEADSASRPTEEITVEDTESVSSTTVASKEETESISSTSLTKEELESSSSLKTTAVGKTKEPAPTTSVESNIVIEEDNIIVKPDGTVASLDPITFDGSVALDSGITKPELSEPTLIEEKDPISIYFNETTGRWISKLSWSPLFMFNLQNDLYSTNALDVQSKMWKHFSTDVPYCNFYGEQGKFEFEFVVVENNYVQKILNNLLFVSNRSFPGRISYTIDNDFDYENVDPAVGETVNSYVQLMKQRHEYVNWIMTDIITPSGVYMAFGISEEEAERIQGGYTTFNGVYYVFGSYLVQDDKVYVQILDQNGTVVNALPAGFTFNRIDFGIIKQNMEYQEDHLRVEVGKEVDKSRIRDKAIKIRVSYEGKDKTFIQSIISTFIYSYT